MKSLKKHLSLIIALMTILFTVQIFMIVDRSITAYEANLKNDYSIIVVAKSSIKESVILSMDKMIERSEELSPDTVLKRLEGEMKSKNIELLKLSLPKFYRIHLKQFPTPKQIKRISENLLKTPLITRVEDFAQNHDTVYRLLLLFKKVAQLFGLAILAVTSLLIMKELRIWQFQHRERMSIMALFGAPVWLRSAVLFRLAIVDALIASVIVIGSFFTIVKNGWLQVELQLIGITIDVFRPLNDSMLLAGVAFSLSILLATMIVMGHKEEV